MLRPAVAAAPSPAVIRGCILAAAGLYHEPPAVLLILLNVEGGSPGAVSHNTNGTVDIGPMQVNQVWIPALAGHWHASEHAAFRALRDNFCANVEAGAWILRQGLNEANGDFWRGVGYYHSHDPGYKRAYLDAVLEQALRLEALARRQAALQSRPSGQQASMSASNRSG
ncbi:MAG: lytic transglycosylase domain-containing protein [Acetobacteraceae bacterium]